MRAWCSSEKWRINLKVFLQPCRRVRGDLKMGEKICTLNLLVKIFWREEEVVEWHKVSLQQTHQQHQINTICKLTHSTGRLTEQKNKWHQKQPHPPPKKSHFTVLSHSHWSGAEMFYLYTLSGRHLHCICVCVRVSYLRFQFRNFQVELVQMFIHKCDQCLRKHKVTHWSNTEKNKNKKTLRRRMKNKIY